MSKKNIITVLALLLVVQTALIAYFYRPGQNQKSPAVRLMDGMDVGNVSSIQITDENGASLLLQKSGSSWSVGKEQFPADSGSIENIIKKLSELEATRLVSRTKSSHTRLKVADTLFNRKVVIGSGNVEHTLYMGTAPSSKSVHLRISGQNEVYQVAGIAVWELQPEKDSWWKSKYVELDPEALQKVSISNDNGLIHLMRSADKKLWQLEPEVIGELDQSKAASLISTISNISIAEYLAKDFSIDSKPVCTLEYQTDNTSVSLQIWPKSEDNDDHVAKLSNASFYAKIRAYIIKDALEASAQGLSAEESTQDLLPAPSVNQ